MKNSYTVPYQPPLPPIHHYEYQYQPQYQNQYQHQPQHQQPSASQASYTPPLYRHDLPRMDPSNGPGPVPPRYQPAPLYPTQSLSSAFPPTPLLPQPNHQMFQQQNYSPTLNPRQGHQTSIAPAPLRNDYPHLSPAAVPKRTYNRPPLWLNVESAPNEPPKLARERGRSRTVGAQGRRGVLPTAFGRGTGSANGDAAGSTKVALTRNTDGKFSCPYCPKAYLHAKHLKRHILRHTGHRPYMCILCRETFSRSDILKRHFHKCAIRRGNPTGATHLSDPAAHVKKSQEAINVIHAVNVATAAESGKVEPKSSATSPISGSHRSSFMSDTNLSQSAQRSSTVSSNTSNFSEPATNAFPTAASTPTALHPSVSQQHFGLPNIVSAPATGTWPSSIEQPGRHDHPPMYHPGQFSLSQPPQMLPPQFCD